MCQGPSNKKKKWNNRFILPIDRIKKLPHSLVAGEGRKHFGILGNLENDHNKTGDRDEAGARPGRDRGRGQDETWDEAGTRPGRDREEAETRLGHHPVWI